MGDWSGHLSDGRINMVVLLFCHQ